MNGFDEWWEQQPPMPPALELIKDDLREAFRRCFAAGIKCGLSMDDDDSDFDADEANRIYAERMAAGLPALMTSCTVANIIKVAK